LDYLWIGAWNLLEYCNESRFKENIEIFIDKLSTPNNVLGVLSTINLVNNYYNFKEPILIVAPDNIFTRNQDELITGFIKGARMAAYETDSLMNAKKYGVAGADDASKQDQLKQNFQRSIRSRFGETIFSINQGNSIDKLIKGLSRRSQVIAVGSNPEGVENVLYQIASAKKFGRIGLAVFEGARNFTERIPRGMRGFEYRLELEYDLIKRELESKND